MNIINKIYTNSHVAGKPGYLTWLSCSGSGYGQMRLGREVGSLLKSKLFHPCHIIYSIYQGQILNAPGYEMSHLRHNKKCINISHVTYEPCTVNQQRKSCNDPAMCHKVCFGHGNYSSCIFQGRYFENIIQHVMVAIRNNDAIQITMNIVL